MASRVVEVPDYVYEQIEEMQNGGGRIIKSREAKDIQLPQFKRKKKKNRKKMPVRKEKLLDLKQFRANLDAIHLATMQEKLVTFLNKDGQHVAISLENRVKKREERIVPTISGAFPFVGPGGDLALAVLNVLKTLVIYDIQSKKKQKSCIFDDAKSIGFCKWIDDATIALITKTQVYHWHWLNNDSPTKIFDRNEILAGKSVSDYLVDCWPDGWHYAILVPEANLDAGENTMMQLYSRHENKSKLLPGYTACFTKLSCGITIAVERSVLCYATFEENFSSFNAMDMLYFKIEPSNEFAVVSDVEGMSESSTFSIRLPSASPIPEPVGHCIGMAGLEKYGVAFYLTSLGWLYLLGLDRDDMLFKHPFHIGEMGNGVFTTAAISVSDDQGIVAVHSSGEIIKFLLNEEVVMNYLVDECNNPELAKYWFWRAGMYQQSAHQHQLKMQKQQLEQREEDRKQLQEQHLLLKQSQESMYVIQQRILLHLQHPLKEKALDQHQLSASLREVQENMQPVVEKIDQVKKKFNHLARKWENQKDRKIKEAHNRGMLKLIRKQQFQLQGSLQQLKLNPGLPWDLGGGTLRYCSVDYYRHKDLEEKLNQLLQKQTLELKVQEEQLSTIEKDRRTLLEQLRQQKRSMVTLLRLLRGHELSEATQSGKQKKQKHIKQNTAKIDPVRAEVLIDLKRFMWQDSMPVELCGNFVTFLKLSEDRFNFYALVDVNGSCREPKTIRGRPYGIRSYVNTTGTAVIEFCHIHDSAIFVFAYDVESKDVINLRCYENIAIEKCYCKWLSSDMAVIVLGAEVYHWFPRNGDSDLEKVFDLDPSIKGALIKDYHLDRTCCVWRWALVVPESNLKDSENISMQLHRNGKKSQMITGYSGYFASCVKGITQKRSTHTYLCYVTFENQSSTFNAKDITEEPVYEVKENMSVILGPSNDMAMTIPILPPHSESQQKDYCIGLHCSKKYGFVFYLSAHGWLYMFGLDGDDCVLAQQFNIGDGNNSSSNSSRNHGTYGHDNVYMSLWGCDNGEAVQALRSDGCVVKMWLDEDTIIPYLVEKVKNPELAKYWAWRSGFFEETRLDEQLQEIQYVGYDYEVYEEQLQHHAIEQGELEGSIQQLDEHLKLQQRQHQQQHIRRSLRLQLQDLTDEQIKVIEQQEKRLEEMKKEFLKLFAEHKKRQVEIDYNRKWRQLQKRHQQQLRGPLEHLRRVYHIENDQMRYCTLEYPRHINIQQELQNRMEDKRMRLEAEMVSIQTQVDKVQEQLEQQQLRHRQMQQKIMGLGEQQMNPVEYQNNLPQQNETLNVSNDSGISSLSSSTGGNTVVEAVESESNNAGSSESNAGATDKQLCIICFERAFDTVLIPCRHMWLCQICADALLEAGKECPACRTKIENIIQVYFPN